MRLGPSTLISFGKTGEQKKAAPSYNLILPVSNHPAGKLLLFRSHTAWQGKMPDYEIRLFVGEEIAARMLLARPSARSARKEGTRFMSQCWEFDAAELWAGERSLGKLRSRRPDFHNIPQPYIPNRPAWTASSSGAGQNTSV